MLLIYIWISILLGALLAVKSQITDPVKQSIFLYKKEIILVTFLGLTILIPMLLRYV